MVAKYFFAYFYFQVSGAEKIVYGYEEVLERLRSGEEKDLIIVEGEMDKLSLNEAGFWNVVSVPDGAPASVKVSARCICIR